MAVAALSTSTIALTANPTPQTATQPAPEGAQAFSKLVAQAKPDDASAQGKPGKGAGGEAEGDIVATITDEAAATPVEGEAKDAAQPIDLLSEIEAMVAAASQITVAPQAVATPAIVPTVKTGTETEADAPAVVGEAAPKKAAAMAATTSTAPALSKAFAKAARADAKAAQPVTPDAKTPAVASASAAPVAVEEAAAAGEAVVDSTTTAAARPPRGNIATLLASLKSAFTQDKPVADSPEATAAPAAAIAAAPASVETPAAPIPAAVDAAAKPTVEAAAAIVTAEAAPIAAPKTGKRAEPKPAADAAAPATPLRAADEGDMPADAAKPAPVASDGKEAARTVATPAPTAQAAPVIVDAALAGVQTGQPADQATASIDGAAPASQADMAVDRHLDLAKDSQWLDRLARDISQAATREGHLKFHLNPQNLGALTIEIANSAAGTAIKLTTETDQARNIIVDAQPQLIAEVRAQGLRVSETHVELNNQPQQGGNGNSAQAQGQQGQQGQAQQQRQSSAESQPFGRRQDASRDDAADSAQQDSGELYA